MQGSSARRGQMLLRRRAGLLALELGQHRIQAALPSNQLGKADAAAGGAVALAAEQGRGLLVLGKALKQLRVLHGLRHRRLQLLQHGGAGRACACAAFRVQKAVAGRVLCRGVMNQKQ